MAQQQRARVVAIGSERFRRREEGLGGRYVCSLGVRQRSFNQKPGIVHVGLS